MEFEWDLDKAASNLAKHAVDFAEAATVFGDPLAITIFDHDHSDDEDRSVTIGSTENHVIALVCHTDRTGVIRSISARKANKAEKANKANKPTPEKSKTTSIEPRSGRRRRITPSLNPDATQEMILADGSVVRIR